MVLVIETCGIEERLEELENARVKFDDVVGGLRLHEAIGKLGLNGSYPEGSDTRDWRSNRKTEGTTQWIRKSEK